MNFSRINKMKFHTIKRKIGVICSTAFLAIIVILSAVFVKYSPIGMILCIFFLFYISFRMRLFKDFEVVDQVTRKNSSIEVAIKEICSLLTMANNSVIITSGSLNEKIWGDDQILRTFHTLNYLGVKILILTGNKLNVTQNGPLYNYIKESIEQNKIVYYCKEEPPDSHFIIIDESHVRLEDRHVPNLEIRKALIKYHRASLAGRAKSKFEMLKIGAQIVTPQDFGILTFNK
jgi:hypothetical protein